MNVVVTTAKKPRITVVGEHGVEEVDFDKLPDPDPQAYDLSHYFDPPRISERAIDLASKIIPQEYAIKHGGLHKLLQKRAAEVFSKLPASVTRGTYGKLTYIFDFDKDGPVLKSVSL